MSKSLVALCGAMILAGSGVASAADLRGDYVEARDADVFTGPCFSNAEVFIYGSQAVLAWKVNSGSYQGVDLSGLSVAAALIGTTTFSEDRPEQAKSFLIVDEKADSRQRDALIAMAKSLAGPRLGNVVGVTTTTMSLKVERHPKPGDSTLEHADHTMPRAPRATFWAAGLAQILTRPLDGRDHFCGNEVIAYPPLSKGVDVLPAYTLGHQFKGQGLGTVWDDPNCRSAFVGSFAL